MLLPVSYREKEGIAEAPVDAMEMGPTLGRGNSLSRDFMAPRLRLLDAFPGSEPAESLTQGCTLLDTPVHRRGFGASQHTEHTSFGCCGEQRSSSLETAIAASSRCKPIPRQGNLITSLQPIMSKILELGTLPERSIQELDL